MQSTTIGIDLAKSTFRIAVADSQRHIAQRRRLTRAQFERFVVHTPPARSVMEGCASAHHWGRLAQAHGHRVKRLHAHYVRAYVRRNKTDAADADALVRADGDRDLKPIGVKPLHRQALQSLHRIRAFASWLGLTPRELSSGSTRALGRISRRGNTYLRMLIIHGARSALLGAKRTRARGQPLSELQRWALEAQARIGHNKSHRRTGQQNRPHRLGRVDQACGVRRGSCPALPLSRINDCGPSPL